VKNSDRVQSSLMYHALAAVYACMILFLPAGIAGAETLVRGSIGTDTVWSAGGSPYTLTGDVTVPAETSLTIDSGVTVNMDGYNIAVEGVLHARGTVFHLSGMKTAANMSTITITAGGSADFDTVTADGKDYIVVQAGATVHVSAPAEESHE
jgi:hypothetical protein